MMKAIAPLGHSPRCSIDVPGSKSVTNRALICAALAKGESVLTNASDSTDTAMLSNGLNQLGVLVRQRESALIVDGAGGSLHAPKFPIPVGNAGTTTRFLLALSSLAQGRVILECDQRMVERPNNELMASLGALGVHITSLPHQARFVIDGGTLQGGLVEVNVEKSSQFLSSLLLVSPYAREQVNLQIDGVLSSEPYVRMTLEVMKAFGVSVESRDDKVYSIRPGKRYSPSDFEIEPDASSASYFLAVPALCGGEIIVRGIKKNSLQGDARFVEIIEAMGMHVSYRGEGLLVESSGSCVGVDIDMNATPDLVPTLAVAGLFAQSTTRMSNIAHLRYKESDRLQALETELKKLGADIRLSEDTLEIHPCALHGAQLDTYGDHRLAMSFALIGLRVPGVVVEDPQCVRKSFPRFWQQFEQLYT